MDIERRRRAFATVEQSTKLPMLMLSVLFIPIIVLPIALDLPSSVEAALITTDWFIWAAFAIELIAKTYLAPVRKTLSGNPLV